MTATKTINSWWGAVLLLIISLVSPAFGQEKDEEITYIDVPGRAQAMVSEPIQITLGGGAVGWKVLDEGNETNHHGGVGYLFGEVLGKSGDILGSDIYLGAYANMQYGEYQRTDGNEYEAGFLDARIGAMLRLRDRAEGISDLSFYSFTLWAGLGYHKDRGNTNEGPDYTGRHEAFTAQLRARLELFFPLFGLGSSQERTKWPGATSSSAVPIGFLSKIDLRGELNWDLSVHRHTTPDSRQRNKWFLLEPRVNIWRFASVPGDLQRETMHWVDIVLISRLQGEIAYGYINPEIRLEHWTYRVGGGLGLEWNIFAADDDEVTVWTVSIDGILTHGLNGREDLEGLAGLHLSVSF